MSEAPNSKGPVDNLSFDTIYKELQHIAHYHLRAIRSGDTLDTSALVHEAFIKLSKQPTQSWKNHTHFLATASRAMRQILVDYARKNASIKRGGDVSKVSLNPSHIPTIQVDKHQLEILDLERALERLFILNNRLGQVIELRFFGGLSIEETAEVLAVTPRTIDRDLFKAKAFLYQAMHGE